MKMFQQLVCRIKGHDFQGRVYQLYNGVRYQDVCLRCGHTETEDKFFPVPDPVVSEWRPSSQLPTASGWYQVQFLENTNLVWRYFGAEHKQWRARGNDPFDILTASSVPPEGLHGTASTHDVFVRRGAQWRGLL